MRPLRALRANEDGVTVVEFALIVPVLLLAVMVLFDLAYNMYTTAMLQGSIQKAARDATLESATAAGVDAKVRRAVQAVMPSATMTFNRRSYSSFTDMSRPEDFTDSNDNGQCDSGEPFEDVNGNDVWDTDRGSAGQGGARDAVLYSVVVTYPRMFPIAKLMNIPQTFTTTARTVLRNQPYGLQNVAAPIVGNCT